VARRTAKDTARLIEEVARGERLLEEIKDPELRETVRLALRLHKDPFSAPDARTRARIRSRVFGSLRPHGATIADRVAVMFEVLAKPAPYAMRALAVAAMVVTVAAGTSVVSSGSVSDDALYSVKLASEQARLALAITPEDRAMVELTIAEHRLAEATELATQGNDDDAIVATSEYGEHLANAAAELAQVETLTPDAQGLVVQLQQKIDTHRAAAAATVARLADSPSTASAAQVLALVAAPADRAASDLSPAAAIAAQAANATDEVANVAERKVTPVATPRAAATTAPAATVRRTPGPQATTGERSRGERAAEIARKAADEAKAAAQKAKEGSRRTPAPTPRHR
jgi:Domain of unknown function (DUF5667)